MTFFYLLLLNWNIFQNLILYLLIIYGQYIIIYENYFLLVGNV